MILFKRVTNTDPDLVSLVTQLDSELKVTDGDDHDFYNQFNGLEGIDHLLVAYVKNTPAACGGFKQIDTNTAEIKRMYTLKTMRGKGLARGLLFELELWAKSLGYKNLVLETGVRQQAAIGLYKSLGYTLIENYGPYVGISESYCFQKKI